MGVRGSAQQIHPSRYQPELSWTYRRCVLIIGGLCRCRSLWAGERQLCQRVSIKRLPRAFGGFLVWHVLGKGHWFTNDQPKGAALVGQERKADGPRIREQLRVALDSERDDWHPHADRHEASSAEKGKHLAAELGIADQIAFVEQQVAAVEQQIEVLLATLEQHVTDIKGIGPMLAASLIAEIGDVHRFQRFESLVAYSGIDPTVFASGEFTATETHMSKRGSPHFAPRFVAGGGLRFDLQSGPGGVSAASSRAGQAVGHGDGCRGAQAAQPHPRRAQRQPTLRGPLSHQ
jgi:hypothetical protein